MDESLASVAVDFSGRPYAVIQAEWRTPAVGGLPVTLFPHFLESFAAQARCNLHVRAWYGRDDHHQAEAHLQGAGRALSRRRGARSAPGGQGAFQQGSPMSEKFDALLIDAGTGNLHSVHNALRSLGFAIRVTSRPEDLAQPGRVILPGVGAFGRFMDGLRGAGLDEPLRAAVQRGDPLLGICVGMQALFEIGEEMGEHPGLGLLPGRVVHFPATGRAQGARTPAGTSSGSGTRIAALCTAFRPVLTPISTIPITAPPPTRRMCWLEPITARSSPAPSSAAHCTRVQFHPEKSQRVGLRHLEEFYGNKCEMSRIHRLPRH